MRLPDFEALVRRQAADIPAEFFEGITEVVVSPRTVPHSEREGVWTLGECIPLPVADGDPRHAQSRIVLFYGSFVALARQTEGFDWAGEAWETLTHEVRHHVEWKARVPDLVAFDDAAEANYARQDGQAFDPLFYRDGLRLSDGSFQVDDDVFLERIVRDLPEMVRFRWSGENLEVRVPPDCRLPAFLAVGRIPAPPPGDLVLVLRRPSRWLDLFRRPPVYQATVEARPILH
ncbi:MAG: metallopeptidase family protein [Gemmatimonadales bacterium]